jgi:hypothetical protein
MAEKTTRRGAAARRTLPTRGKRITLTRAERTFALASLMLLPRAFKKPRVAAMLAEAVRKPAVARKLEKSPKAMLRECGIRIPAGVSVRVHRSSPRTIHLGLRDPRAAAERVHLKDNDLLSEGIAQASGKPAEGSFIPKGRWGGDDGGGDHGDLGTGSNWYNTGNYLDRGGPGDDWWR